MLVDPVRFSKRRVLDSTFHAFSIITTFHALQYVSCITTILAPGSPSSLAHV